MEVKKPKKSLAQRDYGTPNKKNAYRIAAKLTMPHPGPDSIALLMPGPAPEGTRREYHLAVDIGFKRHQVVAIELNGSCALSLGQNAKMFGIKAFKGDFIKFFTKHKANISFCHFDGIKTWGEIHNNLIKEAIKIGTPSLWITASLRKRTKYFLDKQKEFLQKGRVYPSRVDMVVGTIEAMVQNQIGKYKDRKSYDFRIIKYTGIGNTSPMVMVVMQRMDILSKQERAMWLVEKRINANVQ